MKIGLILLFIGTCACQWNQTVYEALKTYSPVFYSHIQSIPSATEFVHLLDQRNYNITFLLPNTQSMNQSIQNGLFNLTLPESTAFTQLYTMILNGSFTTHSFLSTHRQFYQSLNNQALSIGPQIVNNKPTTNIEVISGMTKAITTATEIQCLNGIIQYIDHFLQPAETPLDTISTLSETEYMEGLLKSLNVSDVISGTNKTILVPVNEAWDAINGSTLPYGTLVHNLKYAVLDGIYTLDRILNDINTTTQMVSMTTNYKQNPIQIRLGGDNVLRINDQARFVKTDILTTSGVIHLIDKVLIADTLIETENKTLVPISGTGADTFASSDHQKKTSEASLLHASLYFLFPLLLLFL